MKSNPVVHFEMPTTDPTRVSKFYEQAFGWIMKPMGEAMGNYTLAVTTETNDNGIPVIPGAINGGFFIKSDDKPDQYPSVVISVENIKDAMEKITSAGGTVLGEPIEIPGVGLYVSFRDTEGNRVSLMQSTRPF